MPNTTPTVYVVCDQNCKWESMTKEQIIAAIAEATGTTPTSIDDAFITKIKEQNANAQLKFWVGTTAQFNAITTKASDTFYILTDDDSADSWDDIADDITKIKNGTITVGSAEKTDFTNIAWTDVAANSGFTATAGELYQIYIKNDINIVCNVIKIFSLPAPAEFFDEEWYLLGVNVDAQYITKYLAALNSSGLMKVKSLKYNNGGGDYCVETYHAFKYRRIR